MKITNVNNITLVTLTDFPANVVALSTLMTEIAAQNVNIDMISMAPTHAELTTVSFTISDDDLMKVLAYTKENTDYKVIVSSVNHKISVYDEIMRNTPGIAAKVFEAISDTEADIRLITTSEVEIAFLVSDADYDTVLDALNEAFAK